MYITIALSRLGFNVVADPGDVGKNNPSKNLVVRSSETISEKDQNVPW